MRGEARVYWLVVVPLVGLLCAAAVATLFPPAKPLWLLSASEVRELRIDENGEILSGYWLWTIAVQGAENVHLYFRPEDLSVPANQLPLNVQLPQGSYLKARKGLAIELSPEGPPWVKGIIEKRIHVYDDAGVRRAWPYWAIDDWQETYVPYRIRMTLYENGVPTTTLMDNTLLVGPGEVGTEGPYGIRVTHVGQIPAGVSPPSEDLALVYENAEASRWVRKSDVKNLPTSGYGEIYKGSLPRGRVKIVDKSVGDIYDGGKRWERTGKYRYWVEIRGGFYEMTNEIVIWVKLEQDLLATDEWQWVEIQLVSCSEGFEPESFELIQKGGGGSIAGRDEVKVEKTAPDKFKLKMHNVDGGTNVEFYLRVRGPADKWDEFVEQSGAWGLAKVDLAQARIKEIGVSSVPGRPAQEVWTTAKGLYQANVPQTNYTPGDYSTGERYTVLATLPEGSLLPLITIKAPLEVFDSWIYIPPQGIPKIEGVEPDPVVLYGGGSAKATIKVKNMGWTGDMFWATSFTGLPESVTTSAAAAYIEKGETKGIEVTLLAGAVEKESEHKIDFEVRASSGKKDTGSFTLKLKPGQGSVTPTGSLLVYAFDKATRTPIEGAEVFVAATSKLTDKNGCASFTGIPAGEQIVTVEKEGYAKCVRSATVSKGETTTLQVFLSPPAPTPRWVWAAAALGIILAAAGGAYAYRRKFRRA